MKSMQLFERKGTIGHYLFEYLQKGPQVISSLIPKIKKAKTKASKQAIYSKIRSLKEQGVVVVHKGVVSFNYRWLRNVNRFIQIAQFNYTHPLTHTKNFAKLEEGEKIKYSFTNLRDLCRFWYHSLYILINMHTEQEAFYAYDPHTWFSYTRPEHELDLVTATRESDHNFYQLVGKDTILDQKAGEMIDQTNYFYQIAPKPLYEKLNYHFSTIGTYVIEIKFDQDLAEKIDKIYQKEKKLNKDIIKQITEILDDNSQKCHIIIANNPKKATRFIRMISKHFPKPKF